MEPAAIAQWAHDIRNALGTVALHLESIERSCENGGVEILARSDALLKKATDMCSDLMREAMLNGSLAPRRTFDVTQTIEEVIGLVAPIVPAATTLSLASHESVHVVANPKDVFRILFNLIHNAVGAARTAGTMRSIKVAVEQSGGIATITIADDGPGLPDSIKAHLFRHSRSSGGDHGHGLSIARELAERNGASLELTETARGTEFRIELQGADVTVRRDAPRTSDATEMFEAA